MSKTERPKMANVPAGMQDGLREGVRKAFANVPSEPLPDEHVELLLALRRRERDQMQRAA